MLHYLCVRSSPQHICWRSSCEDCPPAGSNILETWYCPLHEMWLLAWKAEEAGSHLCVFLRVQWSSFFQKYLSSFFVKSKTQIDFQIRGNLLHNVFYLFRTYLFLASLFLHCSPKKDMVLICCKIFIPFATYHPISGHLHKRPLDFILTIRTTFALQRRLFQL